MLIKLGNTGNDITAKGGDGMNNQIRNTQAENPTRKNDKKHCDLTEIIGLLSQGPISSIPLEVMDMPVYAESKMMFGAVFAECLEEIKYSDVDMGTDPVNKFRSMIKQSISEKSLGEIMAKGVCYSEVKAEIVRKEVAEIADNIDFSAYLNEEKGA